MALPSSGQISLNDIRVELCLGSEANFSLQKAATGGYKPLMGLNPPDGNPPHSLSKWYGYTHYNPAITSSVIGVDWFAQTTPNENWNDVAYGQGVFIAVSVSGANRIMRSEDGVNWSPITVPLREWSGIAYGNGRFVAVARNTSDNNPKIMYSTDKGFTWTTVSGFNTRSYNAVIYYEPSNIFIACGSGSTSQLVIYSNSTATSWSSAGGVTVGSWTDITYSRGTNNVVIVGAGTTTRSGYSTNGGISWTITSNLDPNRLWDSVTAGGLFNASVITERVVAVANDGTGNAKVMYSDDGGITWSNTGVNGVGNSPWDHIAASFFGGDDGLFVAVHDAGNTSSIMTSPNGVDWTVRTAPNSNQLNSITYGNGQFVAVAGSGSSNRVTRSYNGNISACGTNPFCKVKGILFSGFNGTWTVTFQNFVDFLLFFDLGSDNPSQEANYAYRAGTVRAIASKTSNGGLGQDLGQIVFKKNGSTQSSVSFQLNDDVSNVVFDFTSVTAGDTLEVDINE